MAPGIHEGELLTIRMLFWTAWEYDERTMKMFLTRLGYGSKLYHRGHHSGNLPGKKSQRPTVRRILKREGIQFVGCGWRVVRHPLFKRIVKLIKYG